MPIHPNSTAGLCTKRWIRSSSYRSTPGTTSSGRSSSSGAGCRPGLLGPRDEVKSVAPAFAGSHAPALRSRVSGPTLLLIGAALLVGYLTVFPLIFLVYGSFLTPIVGGQGGTFTLDNFVKAYADRSTVPILLNSIAFSAGTTTVAFVIGTVLAWITERTNAPLRRFFIAMSLIPLIIPGILFTVSWIFLLSPRIGLINLWLQDLLGLPAAPFNVYSLPGMI